MDLDLRGTTVSSAILHAAGQELQKHMAAEANAKWNVANGDIIITEGGNLESLFVYHAVTPVWDKGKGTAKEVW